MAIKIETPPALKGTQEQQLLQVYGFLFRLSERLNVALQQIDDGTAVTATGQSLNTTVNNPNSVAAVGKSYNELRALIANTGEIIRKEIVAVSSDLERTGSALDGKIDSQRQDLQAQIDSTNATLLGEITKISSEFGTFEENFTTTVQTTAANEIKSYGYDAKLSTLEEQAAGFSEYKLHTEGFIVQGFIDFDETTGAPIVGVAIGEGLITEEYEYNGETYKKINANQNCAFYRADRVSFRVNGVEAAYLSNQMLWITNAVLTGNLQLGTNWVITGTPTFEVKFLGG